MKRILLSVLLLSAFYLGFGQTIVDRASAANTVRDARGMWRYNAFMPQYTDTTSANLQKGIDSCGAVIYTRSPQAMWYRACSPKRWLMMLDSASLSSVINNSVNNLSILNDSTIIICKGNNVCDTVSIVTNITNITSISFLTDSSIRVCNSDTIPQCDTIVINPQPIVYVFQNGLTTPVNAPYVIEWGTGGKTLIHNTLVDAGPFKMNFSGTTINDFPVNFIHNINFGDGTGIASFFNPDLIKIGGSNNTVKAGIHYTGSTTDFGGGTVPGFFGANNSGYWFGANAEGFANSNTNLLVNDITAKIGGLFLHTNDTSNTYGVSIFTRAPTYGTTTIPQLQNNFVAHFRTNGRIQFPFYDSSSVNDGVLTKVFGTDAQGNVLLGTVTGGGGSLPSLAQTHMYVGNASNTPVDAGAGLTYNSGVLRAGQFSVVNGGTAIDITADGTLSYFGLGAGGDNYVIAGSSGAPSPFTSKFTFDVQYPIQFTDRGNSHNLLMALDGTIGMKLGIANTYSSGGYDVLVKNQTTGYVEKTTISVGGITTADNGLTANTSTNVRLGGTLLTATTIATAGNTLTISTSTGAANPLTVSSTTGTAINANATTGLGLSAYSANSIALQSQSDGSNYAGDFRTYNASSNNTVQSVLRIMAFNGNAPSASGFGAKIDYELMTTDFGTTRLSNQIISKWTTATDASRTSQLSFIGVESGTTNTLLTLDGNKKATFAGEIVQSTNNSYTTGGYFPLVYNGSTGRYETNTGMRLSYRAITSTYTPAVDDYVIDCTSGTFSVTLPTASTNTGTVYIIKNSGAGVITVTPFGAETIDGAASYSLSTQYKYVTIQSKNSGWVVIGNN